jgi:hypothetical protein
MPDGKVQSRRDAHTGANQTVPYGTALLRWRCPRHSCLATVMLSLWAASSSRLWLSVQPLMVRGVVPGFAVLVD